MTLTSEPCIALPKKLRQADRTWPALNMSELGALLGKDISPFTAERNRINTSEPSKVVVGTGGGSSEGDLMIRMIAPSIEPLQSRKVRQDSSRLSVVAVVLAHVKFNSDHTTKHTKLNERIE